MRYSLTLCYDGSSFFGWQSQPGVPTVQDTLEDALGKLLRCRVSVTGAGRTDTSVNAIGYVAHFDAEEGLDTEALGYKLNAILPPSVVVLKVSEAPAEFHSRFDATNREYTYFLHRRKDPFARQYSLLCLYMLDTEAMNKAAEMLLGTHDFSCFQKTGTDVKTSICTVTQAGWHSYTPSHCSITHFPCNEGDYLYFRICADRFLRNMVRAVVGSLIDVGRGKMTLEQFRALVLPADRPPVQPGVTAASPGAAASASVASTSVASASVAGARHGRPDRPSRSDAGESVPGHALFLSSVSYPTLKTT